MAKRKQGYYKEGRHIPTKKVKDAKPQIEYATSKQKDLMTNLGIPFDKTTTNRQALVRIQDRLGKRDI